jgi:hypothetical protein
MEINRRHFIASIGGTAAAATMSHEARAEALETYMMREMEGARQGRFPTAAQVESEITTRHYRRGVGNLFLSTDASHVARLDPMPDRPTLLDFFELRFARTRNHCLQSAAKAVENGVPEPIVLACLLHDVVQEMIKSDHGYWGAQMFEPYVPEETSFAIKYHQALRFYADAQAGYEYPDLYHRIFGEDYVPAPYIKAAYEYARSHRWYMGPRMVTVSDLYAFEEGVEVSLDPFVDIVGRHFRQPAEGLGYDNSPVAHMWRTLANPDAPL